MTDRNPAYIRRGNTRRARPASRRGQTTGARLPPPRDWLSISHRDHLQGWVEFEQSGDDRLATLCLAITRGPTHVNRQVDLPLERPL
jgi:hypothetical protein